MSRHFAVARTDSASVMFLAIRACLMALAASATAMQFGTARGDTSILGYQFTGDVTGGTFNPTTVASNLVGSPFTYVNANPSSPPFNNPPFIVQGGTLPDDPAYFIGQGDWFPVALGYNENYYTFSVSVSPGFAMNVNTFSFAANSRQQVPFLTQIQYSTRPALPIRSTSTRIKSRFRPNRSGIHSPPPTLPSPAVSRRTTFVSTDSSIHPAMEPSAICSTWATSR